MTEIPQTEADKAESEKETKPQAEAETTPSQDTPQTQPSFAGYTTHSPLRLSTKYYTAEVPIWVDEVPLDPRDGSSTSSSATWKDEFLSEEAEIVREAVGALVVTVRAPCPRADIRGVDVAQSEDVLALCALMRDIGAVKGCIDEERGGMDVPGVLLLVGSSAKLASSKSTSSSVSRDPGMAPELEIDGLGEDAPLSVGWWEDRLFDMGLFGWEVVEWDPAGEGEKEKTRNKFGGMFLLLCYSALLVLKGCADLCRIRGDASGQRGS